MWLLTGSVLTAKWFNSYKLVFVLFILYIGGKYWLACGRSKVFIIFFYYFDFCYYTLLIITYLCKYEIFSSDEAFCHSLFLGQGGGDIEESGSLLGCSRHSLADTSVTSTADLSVLSAARSQALDNSLDTHSYNSEGSLSQG